MGKRIYFTGIICLILLGCNEPQYNNNNSSNTKQESGNVECTLIEDENNISDIENWKHPVKDYMKLKNIKLVKVELENDKTYPTFYVEDFDTYYFEDLELFSDIAEKNGYWDYKLVADEKFAEVYCDKKNKIVTQIVTDSKTIKVTAFDFTKYNQKWYSDTYAHVAEKYFSMLDLNFKDGSNECIVNFESNDKDDGYSKGTTKVYFDCLGHGEGVFTDNNKNKIGVKILLENDCVKIEDFKIIKKNSDKNIFSMGFSEYTTAKEIERIRKAFKIVKEKSGYTDAHEANYIPKADDEDFDLTYFSFEGKTDDGKYRIGIRRCRDTVIVVWWNINTDTGEVEEEN